MLSKNKRFRETQMGSPPKMAAAPESPERKRSLKLSLLVGLAETFTPDPLTRSPSSKSPRSFDDGAVGLGIVAAMSGGGSPEPRPAAPVRVRSDPIPIVPARPAAKLRGLKPTPREEDDDDEEEEEEDLSESYTCVISHMGGRPVRKRVYLNDGSDGIENYRVNSGVFFESPLEAPAAGKVVGPPLLAADFLSCCYLCRKKLHGLDIFMYRGEKAFCSPECRCQQILSDEQGVKCRSEALKTLNSSCVSPCRAPFLFSAGVAVA